MLIISSTSMDCPPKCECSPYSIKCNNAGLKEMPDNIPLSVTSIDFSNNPLLHIKRGSFLNFSRLNTLLLNGCNQKDPIDLPNSLQKFGFASNSITTDTFKMMFRNRVESLLSLDLNRNHLNAQEVLPVISKKIVALDLSGNNWPVMKSGDLKCCKKLHKIVCQYCGLKHIEPNAFSDTKDLVTIDLSNNELTDLPDKLFAHCSKLTSLHLRSNQLESFNSKRLDLKRLLTLALGYNNIKSFDLRSTSITDIGLESNKITQLDANAFKTGAYLHVLALQRNNIKRISAQAFSNVKLISELLLHNNNIQSIPKYVFNNTQIEKLLLHQNNFSNLNGVLLGIRGPIYILTLFSNKRLKNLDASDFESMNEKSQIFVTCKNLKTISSASKLKAVIKCSPESDLILKSPSKYFAYDGYECTYEFPLFRCRACPVGFYSNCDGRTEKRGECIECPAGSFYQNELASLKCKNCPIGQYVPPDRSPGKGAADCQTCPAGTNTNASAETRACKCLNGFYRRHRFGACERCTQVGFVCTKDYPQLKDGYWMTWNGTNNKTCREDFKAFVANLETTGNDYDRSTMHYNFQLPMPIKCPIPGSCRGGIDSECSIGYSGVLCSVCSNGYSRQFNRCVKCSKPIIVILEFFGYIAAFILFCFIILLTDKMLISSAYNGGHRNRTFADIVISSFKILIGFYQILLSLLHAFSNISWPQGLLRTMSALDYIQFEVLRVPSLRCIKPEWEIDVVKEFWFVLIITLTIPALSVIYFLLKACFLRFQEIDSFKLKRKRIKCGVNCIKFVALFLFTTYPLTSTKIFQILPVSCHSFCTAKHDGVCVHTLSYLRSDYSIPCPTFGSHRSAMVAAYCSLVIPFGLPIVLWLLLWRYAPTKQLPKSDTNGCSLDISLSDTLEGIDPTDDYLALPINCSYSNITSSSHLSAEENSVFLQALKFAYENYHQRCWFWEVIEMIRKFVMTVGVALLFSQTKLGLSSAIVLAVLFALLHAAKKPMKDKFENFVQLVSLLTVPINLSVGAVLQTDLSDDSRYFSDVSESWLLGIFLMFLNSLLIFLFAGRFVKGVYKKLSNFLLNKRK